MGPIILVTGANRGIGYAIVTAISRRVPNSTILMGCRDVASGEAAVKQQKEEGTTANLDVVRVDLEDDQGIVDAAKAVEQNYGKLDVLINNAIKLERTESKDFATIRAASNACFNNGITSNAIVTEAFLPLLRKSSWGRVVMVSSTRGSLGRTANRELPPVAVVDYCIVKAGLNMMTLQYHIAEEQRPEAERVTFWAVSPGHCKTGFNGFRGVKDPVEGAEVVVRLLESEKGAISGGTFWEFENDKFQQPAW